MLHDRISKVDAKMADLLGGVEFVCGLSQGTSSGLSFFTFFEMCFDKYKLKRRAKDSPFPTGLNSKVSDNLGTDVEVFLREYCRLRGVVFEGYEDRKLHFLIAAFAPGVASRCRQPRAPTLRERQVKVIKQRRANKDL